jgi:hypothetical protein
MRMRKVIVRFLEAGVNILVSGKTATRQHGNLFDIDSNKDVLAGQKCNGGLKC